MALALVAMATVIAITNVLSATTQHTSASFTVTYEANNVNATVLVASKTQSESAFDEASPLTFSPTATTVTGSLTATSEELGGIVSVQRPVGVDEYETVDVFQRYAVYKFTFTNNNPVTGKGLDVSATYTFRNANYENNVLLLWVKSDSSTLPNVEPPSLDNASVWPSQTFSTGTQSVALDSNGESVASNIVGGQSAYLYLFVAIADVSLRSDFVLDSVNGNSLVFTLTPTPTQSSAGS